MITIVPVLSSKDKKAFIQFPKGLYKGNPHWVAPLDMDMKVMLNPKKHPFYEYGTIEPFLALRDGKVIGRIAAVTNALYAEHHDAETAFFGFFECINDQSVADALFDHATDVLKSKGFSKVHGPASPSCNYDFGLLTEGFDDSPRIMMTYNFPYYIDLILNHGFHKAQGLVAYKLSQEKVFKNEKFKRIAELAQKRYNVTIRNINLKKMDEEIKIVKKLYDACWEENWGHVPMTGKELDAMAKALKPLAVEDLIMFAEVDGEPIGFCLCLPDYYDILKEMNGKLLPFNFIKLFTKRKQIDWCRILLLGVDPKYRGKAIDAMLYLKIIMNARKHGYDYGEGSWMLEDNEMIVRGMELMDGEIYKRYAIYEKSI